MNEDALNKIISKLRKERIEDYLRIAKMYSKFAETLLQILEDKMTKEEIQDAVGEYLKISNGFVEAAKGALTIEEELIKDEEREIQETSGTGGAEDHVEGYSGSST